jgi:hypothetical protein
MAGCCMGMGMCTCGAGGCRGKAGMLGDTPSNTPTRWRSCAASKRLATRKWTQVSGTKKTTKAPHSIREALSSTQVSAAPKSITKSSPKKTLLAVAQQAGSQQLWAGRDEVQQTAPCTQPAQMRTPRDNTQDGDGDGDREHAHGLEPVAENKTNAKKRIQQANTKETRTWNVANEGQKDLDGQQRAPQNDDNDELGIPLVVPLRISPSVVIPRWLATIRVVHEPCQMTNTSLVSAENEYVWANSVPLCV